MARFGTMMSDTLGAKQQSLTFLFSEPVSKPKCQSQECDIFGFETGFETKISLSAKQISHLVYKLRRQQKFSVTVATNFNCACVWVTLM